MKKYKQKIIPSVNTPEKFTDKSRKELELFVSSVYNNRIRGKSVVNKCLGYEITFSGRGLRKITKGSTLYPYKAIAVTIIDKLLEVAEYSNFGNPKDSDSKEIAGYLNFKVKCKIDGKTTHLRISTTLYKNSGKIYWNHEINKKDVKP